MFMMRLNPDVLNISACYRWLKYMQ